MNTVTEAAILQALTAVRDPDFNRDIVSLKFVKNLRIEAGEVSFTIELATPVSSAKQAMRDLAHDLVARIPGVTQVRVEMTAQVRPAISPELSKTPVPGVKNVIAVGAGKGGVGKTTVAVNLAIALSQSGARVAIIDGDVYGPNIPIMLGISTQLQTDGQKIVPAERYGIQLVSMGFLTGDDSPVIWRGPMLHGVIQQFFREVRWDNVDYLIVDLPPGTGDIALSLSQSIHVSGSVVVTTPQTVSVADTRRAVRMYQKLNIATLGLVENMSHFVCPSCSHESDIFGKGGGEALANELGVPFLGRVPIYEPIRLGGDTGIPVTIGDPQSSAAHAFRFAAERLASQIAIATFNAGQIKRPIPLTQVR
jgi:ATP-binding protein involved in chromosome partitioning